MHKISYWNDQAVPEDDSRRSTSRNNNNRLNYNMMQSSKFITYRTNKQQHFSDDGGKKPNHKNTYQDFEISNFKTHDFKNDSKYKNDDHKNYENKNSEYPTEQNYKTSDFKKSTDYQKNSTHSNSTNYGQKDSCMMNSISNNFNSNNSNSNNSNPNNPNLNNYNSNNYHSNSRPNYSKKYTNNYSNSNRPFRQLILMDLPENLHSIDNLADRFKPYGKIFGIQVLRPEDFHQLSPDAKRYLGENIKNNVSNNSKTLPTTCGAIIEFETARTAKFCCGVLRKRVVEQGFRVAVLKPGAESELVAQGQALKRSFESKDSKSSSCVDSYSSRGESISSNSSGNEDVAKALRSDAGNVQTSRNIPVQNYFIQKESVQNEIKHNIQHKIQDITTNNIHNNNHTPNQTKFQNSGNYHPTQTFNLSQTHNQNCNQIYPQNHNKISGQIHAQHNHTQQTSDAPYNTSYNSAYNQYQTHHQNPTYNHASQASLQVYEQKHLAPGYGRPNKSRDSARSSASDHFLEIPLENHFGGITLNDGRNRNREEANFEQQRSHFYHDCKAPI